MAAVQRLPQQRRASSQRRATCHGVERQPLACLRLGAGVGGFHALCRAVAVAQDVLADRADARWADSLFCAVQHPRRPFDAGLGLRALVCLL